MKDFDFEAWSGRIGRFHLEQRLSIQVQHAADVFGPGLSFVHIENMLRVHAVIRFGLRCLGIYGRGRRNACAIETRVNEVRLGHLPAAFDGFTLLHLSDLHADLDPAINRAIAERVAACEADVCVVTGDYRGLTHGPWEAAVRGTAEILSGLRMPAYGVLGNHDFIEMAPGLEEAGLRLLMNEHVAIERDGARIWLLGVDDPHLYEAANPDRAAQGTGGDDVRVLLCHSPEIHRRVSYGGIDLMLCGHTHGGQFCLPGGFAPICNARAPRRMARGAWRSGRMQGYTSTGCGCSGVEARYNCPPEIVLHRLRRG